MGMSHGMFSIKPRELLNRLVLKPANSHPLTRKEKQRNPSLARKRTVIEHIFRKLKVCRILSERYRKRRTRFSLRFNLIAAIYNLELH